MIIDAYYDLMAGLGGFGFALYRSGIRVKKHFFSEINPFCVNLYKKRFPEAVYLGDIHNYEKWEICEGSKLFTAGFPCQPFSNIGKRKGRADVRNLWPVLFRCVQYHKPDIVLFENVPAIDTGEPLSVLEEIYDNLESEGYETLPPVEIPAVSFCAPHYRARIWILAYSESWRRGRGWRITEKEKSKIELEGLDEDSFRTKLSTGGYGRGNDGFSHWMDRLKGLGNSIVPHIAEKFFRVIKALNEMEK